MQPLTPDVFGISKTPWIFGQLVNSRRFFSKPENLFVDIHGNLGKHLKITLYPSLGYRPCKEQTKSKVNKNKPESANWD